MRNDPKNQVPNEKNTHLTFKCKNKTAKNKTIKNKIRIKFDAVVF